QPAVPGAAGAVSVFALAILLVGAAAGLLADRRLGHIRDADLRERGLIAGEAQGAALSLDTRALGQALAEAGRRVRRSRSSTMRWLMRVPVRLRAAAALISTDVLLLRRTPRHLVQVAASAFPAIAVLLVPEPSPWALIGLVVGG